MKSPQFPSHNVVDRPLTRLLCSTILVGCIFFGLARCHVAHAAPPSITAGTESVTVTTAGVIAFPAGRQLVQTFTAATKAATVPVATGQVGWETDTGVIYRATGTIAGNWSAISGGGGSSTLAGMSDVNFTSLASGDFMKYDGTDWINLNAAATRAALGLGTLAELSAIASAQITDGTIVNADISASAAIALSKLATDPLARANHTGTQLLSTISDAGTLAALSAVASAQITDGTIVDADINASAAIALSKLATDPLARANHTGTQLLSTISDAGSLAALSTVASAQITDGTIVDADISGSAAISLSKLASTGTLALGASGQISFETTAVIINSGGIAADGFVNAGTFNGDGAGITGLNASNLSSGTVATARLGSGTANSTTFLRGDNTWAAAGAGTVTSVSVTTANGISGTVATATTTPAITLSLGAITPTTVNGNTFTAGTGTLTFTGSSTLTVPATGTAALLGTANVFTALQTITQGTANTGILASTGYSLTGSNATNMIDLAGTWNTSGLPTGLKINITNTASGAGSKLLDVQADGTSRFAVGASGNDGWMAGGNTIIVPNFGGGSRIKICGLTGFFFNPNDSFTLPNGALIGWCSSSNGPGNIGSDTDLQRVSAGILKLRNGTTTEPAYFQVWGNSTGSKYLSLGHDGTDGVIVASSGAVTMGTALALKAYTVATLPSTAATGMVAGAMAYVTDATAPTYLGALTGGGAVVCPVFYTGTAWVSH